MRYQVEFTKAASKKFQKLDSSIKKILLSWITKNLQNCSNPRAFGKALKGNLSDKWRYRVGDYRIMAKIEDSKIIITIVDIGHRKDIYE
ncbi:MAG: type II toxin-antitoxin system RelE/ParE family toxin [Fusobacterium necrophorum]|nr:type II toxin-antitoxin system RelE/ParE family toxin [Fusobacterium necrophorum]MCI7681402.1 type II toxin-antitoxin system RelE/ParE family toxin [Fusobacterium necrophorum]MDY2572860.1 type II toxin-antitoxin system RelE/ParE family toxin [Fusobacterium necrophorum]MDY6172942.1 type II toxin-antitoxin system RelE/ParE family toxin [Fusobacterium necrophorum]